MSVQLAEDRRGSGVELVASVLWQWMENKLRGPSLVDTKGISRPASFGAADEKVFEKTSSVWQRQLPNFAVNSQ